MDYNADMSKTSPISRSPSAFPSNGKAGDGCISKVRLTRFTAFQDLEMTCSPGVNILIGANGTGKTHIMKALYAACDITTGQVADYPEKLVRVFMPFNRVLGRLVKRQEGAPGRLVRRQDGSPKADILVCRGGEKLRVAFTRFNIPKTVRVTGGEAWGKVRMESVYIPVKEMLANAPGFRSLYNQRHIHFEEVYADILDRAYLPPPLSRASLAQRPLLQNLGKVIQGRVVIRGEEFFLRDRHGYLEFSLLAEGMRKLGLLWLLIRNGALAPERRVTLFWDEPETNLNPKMFRMLADILLQLQRDGAQIFLATHSYELLKEFDLQSGKTDRVAYHSLFEENGDIQCNTTADFSGINPNAAAEVWDDIYERELERAVGGVKR